MKISPDLVAPAVSIVYRLWCSTLRITETGREGLDALEAAGKPAMVSLWHDELFTLMHVRRTLRIVTVVSKSRDGEYLARLLQSLGLKTARGSSSRGGLEALRQAARLMREQGYNGCITVDGPRGPRHQVKPGAIALAHRTPAHVVAVRLFPQRAFTFSSWDRFQLPLPFSRVHIVFDQPYLLPPDEKLTQEVLERERLELERRLNSLRPPDMPEDASPLLKRIVSGIRQNAHRTRTACTAAVRNIIGRAGSTGAGSTPEGSSPEGSSQEGTAQEGAARNGAAREGQEKGPSPLYVLLRFLADMLSRLSWKSLDRLAACMAFCFWHVAPGRRNEAIASVARHLDLPQAEAVRIARESFRQNFLSFLEILHAGRFHTDSSVSLLCTPETKALLQAETGPIVIAAAHLGSWEMMPGLAADLLPDRVGMVIVRSQKHPALNRLVAELRGARGMLVIDHRKATQAVLPKLRDNGVAAFLVDHNTSRKEAVFLPFLGDTAAVNMGPASLALRTKAAVYPVFLLRDGKGGHILHLLPPLRTAELTGSIKERIRQIAAFYTDAVADMVRACPEQWFWMHRRWKTRERGKS